MTDLSEEQCQVCRPGALAVDDAEARVLLAQLPEWRVVEHDHVRQLERVFTFPDFEAALRFTNRVGALAEAHGHHPALLTEWGRVTVRWWTHTISGLHRNDFVMAAKTDAAHRDSRITPAPS